MIENLALRQQLATLARRRHPVIRPADRLFWILLRRLWSDECYANLECRVADTRLVSKYGLFILEVVKAWIDRARKHPRTIHHLGGGHFMVAGRTIRLSSGKK